MGQKHSFPYFDGGKIVISVTSPQIVAGQQLEGFVHVDQKKEFRARSLFLCLVGYEKSTFSVPSGENGQRTQISERYPICRTEWLLINLQNEKDNLTARPGQYTVPFSVTVPNWLPPSTAFSNRWAHIYAAVSYVLLA